MDHRVHRDSVDEEVTKRSPESRLPFDWIDGRPRLFLEQTAVTLKPGGRIISRRLRRQCETEKLCQIALRCADGRKLPVVGAKTRRDARQAAKHNIPWIEVVVN